jgi:2-aminoadipate transaminase
MGLFHLTAPEEPITQATPRPGITDLGPGYLDAELLATELLREACLEALETWGPSAMAYGANAGPPPLRRFLAAKASTAGGTACTSANVLVTGGTSTMLSELAARLAGEGTVLLTEALTYDLGRAIFAELGVRVVAVPGLPDLDPDELRRTAVRTARSSGKPPALYVAPTFHNPTGRVLSLDRRRAMLAVAEQTGMRVIEDQAYADLDYGDEIVPPPLTALADDPDSVVGLYSFSKSLAPGIRVGWLIGSEKRVSRLETGAERRSGGGPSHFAALAVAAACTSGSFDAHLVELRRQLRLRRDAALSPLLGALPPGFSVRVPTGGYFVWVDIPAAVDDRAVLREAEARGMSCALGRRFGADARGLRLCFAGHPPAALAAAAERFVAACRAAAR